jgi:methionyl aminopeptidase
MIYLKTDEEIELMRESNLLVSKTHAELAKIIEPGITTLKLDAIAESFIRDHKAEPAFLGYNGFPNTLCVSVNDTVVHGIPSDYVLREGDIVSIDCGVYKNGYYGDSAYTFAVGSISNDVKNLLSTTKESLFLAIESAIAGNRIGDIGYAVQSFCEKKSYSVVREMVGHGIGKKLHEKPEVPNYGQKGRGILLKHGMVLAIEPMINMGKKDIFVEKDGWTIRTKDGKPSAHFEHTVAIKKSGVDVLSDFSFIEEVLKNKSN